MSITKTDDFHHLLECDYCEFGEEIQTDDDWNVLMSEMKERGWWKIKDKATGQWSHKCPTCVEKGKKDYGRRKQEEKAAPPPPDDEPPLDAYDDEDIDLDDDPFGPDESAPAPAPAPEKRPCVKYPMMKVDIEHCRRCGQWDENHGCTEGL